MSTILVLGKLRVYIAASLSRARFVDFETMQGFGFLQEPMLHTLFLQHSMASVVELTYLYCQH